MNECEIGYIFDAIIIKLYSEEDKRFIGYHNEYSGCPPHPMNQVNHWASDYVKHLRGDNEFRKVISKGLDELSDWIRKTKDEARYL